MKQVIKKTLLSFLLASLIAPATLLAQKEEKVKDAKDKGETEQIIITRKGNKDEKVTVEVNGDKVLINGKEIDKDGDITVRRHKIKDAGAYTLKYDNNYSVQGFNGLNALTTMDENRAMLGVTTEKSDDGADVQSVTKESGAEKAGLKEGDIITKIDDKKIEDPDDLSAAIKGHKPGDKVNVTYLRDKKEAKVSAELGKWQGMSSFSFSPNQNFNMQMDDMSLSQIMPKVRGRVMSTPRAGYNYSWSTGGPKLGVSVQDTEDGKGVEVLDVDEDGNAAKAGIKEDDVITDVNGTAVNSADEMAKVMRDNKDKTSVKVKLLRKGKTENVEVKIPKKLKTADL
ncbi:MAG TPA: PDZ domain-containing protein [Chitinophagaceae bacterium]|nr:PDZ domain-containing protein [Chitinophagaceae bacterium]